VRACARAHGPRPRAPLTPHPAPPRQSERVDRFEGVLLVHSLGGGTGSGLGSRLLEELREEYGARALLVSAAVAPFSCGDTPAQAYNVVLAVAAAARAADAVLFFGNDDALARAARAARAAATLAAGASAAAVADARVLAARARGGGADAALAGLPPLTTVDLNATIAEALCAVTARVRRSAARDARGRAVFDRGGGGAPPPAADARPAWVDTRPPPRAPEEGVWEAAPPRGAVAAADDAPRGAWLYDAAAAARANVAALLADDGAAAPRGGGGGGGGGEMEDFDFADLLNDVVAGGPPLAKFLDVRTARAPAGARGGAGAASSWGALADALVDAAPRFDAAHRPVAARAVRLVARGAGAGDVEAAAAARAAPPPPPRAAPGVGLAPPPAHWPGLPPGADWAHASLALTRGTAWAGGPRGAEAPRARSAAVFAGAPGAPRALAAVANSDAFAATLVRAVARADALLGARAYVHAYERYGVGADEIGGALHACLDVVEAYRPGGAGALQREG